MQSSDIRVISDPQTIEYIFDSENAITMTEFKAAQGLADRGLLCPVKAKHNGCDKLIFKIAGLSSLSDVVRSEDGGNMVNVGAMLRRIIDEVRGFGFLQVQHLDWDMDRIFADLEHKRIFMVYLPADIEDTVSWESKYRRILDDINCKNPNMLTETSRNLDAAQAPADTADVRQEDKHGLFKRFFNGSKGSNDNPEQRNVQRKEPPKKGNPKRGGGGSAGDTQYAGGTVLLENVFIPTLVISGVNTPQRIESVVAKDEFVIGKNPQATDLTIEFSKAVSNRHCSIICKNGVSYVVDHQSTNGTFLNGVRVQSEERVQIKAGDKLRLANCDFVIRSV